MSGRKLRGTLEPKFNPFDQNYLGEVLEAIATAWNRMRQPKRNELEDSITCRLAGRLLNDSHFSDFPFDVVTQYWLLGLNGERLGRLDLRFKHRSSQRDYFAFESKRLHVKYPRGSFSSEYPTYAGDEGMMAFVLGQYCKGLPTAGMLGYIMDGRLDKAWTGLVRRIQLRRQPLRLLEDTCLAASILSQSLQHCMQGKQLGETEHGLETYILRIYHLLLPVRPPARRKSR
jgi:hypothetical protein